MGRLRKMGLTIATVVAVTLPTYVAAAERIEFGPPGPPQTIAFQDAVASASVTFRVSPDAKYGGGEAGASPSISSGSLTMRAFGTRREYDLSTILPTATDHVVLSKESGCGTATALSRSGGYMVIEATLAQKGCAAFAAFVDLHDGHVVKEAVFDSAWDHRFDVHPYHASGEPIRIVRVERVVLDGSRWNSDGRSATFAWPFLIVHATDARGAMLGFAVDGGDRSGADQLAVALKSGEPASLGTSDIGDPNVVVRLFTGQRFVRPGDAAESRSDARQTPTPQNIEASIRRNHWFREADDRAERGDIVGAVDAFATMVSLRGGGADIDAGDAAMLATCRDLVRRVRAGSVSAKTASAAFPSGCIVRPAQK